MAKIRITLTAYNLGNEATEKDFDNWAAFVGRHIDFPGLHGHEVEVDQHTFGEGPDQDTVSVSLDPGDDLEEDVRTALRSLWDDWCAAPYSLRDFVREIPGGLVQNDRGNGSAGPLWLGEGSDLDEEALDEGVTLVTEEEDPDAWYLAREALAAVLTGSGAAGGTEPHIVAVGARAEGDNGHQTIFAG